eukprot:1177019-Prorocentrum_minimum.AAC.13
MFFAASVGFEIPVKALFHTPALKFGALLTVAAFLGKFLSGVFGATGSDPVLGMTQSILESSGGDTDTRRP